MHMKKIIEESERLVKEALNNPIRTIKEKFVCYFGGIDWNESTQDNGLFEIENNGNVEKLHSGPGFYVILTDYKYGENDCTLIINGGFKAIYRGHCSNLRRRVESHLFNKQYNEEYSKRKTEKKGTSKKFSEVPFNACMKIDAEDGINIDENTYSQYEWLVFQIKMPKSSRLTRELAEHTFDELYKTPLGNIHEKKRKLTLT